MDPISFVVDLVLGAIRPSGTHRPRRKMERRSHIALLVLITALFIVPIIIAIWFMTGVPSHATP